MSVAAATTISWQSQYRERVEGVLERYLPGNDSPPARLHQAMRYAALGPGKRIRPVLVYATGVAVGLPPAALDGPAAAVELIHAYSLVHDDLPAMDDDDLRRGRPTTHRAFDEATAILAGDALQVLAFEILADDSSLSVDPAQRLEMIRTLAHASGTQGMAGGQAMDLAAVGQAPRTRPDRGNARAQDRRPDPRRGADCRQARRPRFRRRGTRRWIAMARRSACHSRSSTTCWMCWATRRSPARPAAPTRCVASRLIPQLWESPLRANAPRNLPARASRPWLVLEPEAGQLRDFAAELAERSR